MCIYGIVGRGQRTITIYAHRKAYEHGGKFGNRPYPTDFDRIAPEGGDIRCYREHKWNNKPHILEFGKGCLVGDLDFSWK